MRFLVIPDQSIGATCNHTIDANARSDQDPPRDRRGKGEKCAIVSLLDEYPYVNMRTLDATFVESLTGTKNRRPRGVRETTLSPLGNDEEQSGSNNRRAPSTRNFFVGATANGEPSTMDQRMIRSRSPSPSIGTTKSLEEDYRSREITGSEGSNRRRRRRGETLRDSAGGFAAVGVFVRGARTHTHTSAHVYVHDGAENQYPRPTDRPTDPPTMASRRADATRRGISVTVTVVVVVVVRFHPPSTCMAPSTPTWPARSG